MTKLEELKAAAEAAAAARAAAADAAVWATADAARADAAYYAELKRIQEENPMAKLEELKAAAEAARDDARAAVYDALDAVVVVDDEYVADAAAWDAEAVLAAAADAARDAYEAELKKTQE